MANLTDADKVLRNDTGKSIVSKLDGIKDAIVAQGGGAHSLDQLSDVEIDSQTLAAGQSIVYNDVTEKFENGEVSTVAALDDLTDVSITSAQKGDSLRNDGNGNWINQPTTVAMTQDDWDDIQDKTAWRNAHKNTHIVITDAPNLNATAQDISYDGGADTVWDKVESLDTGKQSRLFTKTINITGATGVAWTPHYYCDIDISGYFTGLDANAGIIGIIPNAQTSGGVLMIMLQGARTLRLLNDQPFTNVACNVTLLYYRP